MRGAAVAAPSRLPGSRAVRERAAATASHLSEGEAGKKGPLVGGVEAIDLKRNKEKVRGHLYRALKGAQL